MEHGLWQCLSLHKAFQLVHNAALLLNSYDTLIWYSQGDQVIKRNESMEHLSYTEKCQQCQNHLFAKLTQVNLTWNKTSAYRFSWKNMETFIQNLNCIQRGKKNVKVSNSNGLQPKFHISKAVTKELDAYTIQKKNKNAIIGENLFNWKAFILWQCVCFLAFCV